MYTKTLELKRPYVMTITARDNYPFGLAVNFVVDEDEVYKTELDMNDDARKCALKATQSLQAAFNRDWIQVLTDEEERALIAFLEAAHKELLGEWKRLYDFGD